MDLREDGLQEGGISQRVTPWFATVLGGGGGADRSGNFILQIPDDLIPEILKLLPLKSLCRFMCVSSYWQSLIISNYHESSRRPIVGKITMAPPYKKDVLSKLKKVRLCSIDGHGIISYDVCNSKKFGGIKILGVEGCNGFLCCTMDIEDRYLHISNPITQENITIPNHNGLSVKLGFHPSSKKYKLLGHYNCPRYDIYTLGETNSSWRPVTSTPPEGSGKPCAMSSCIKGFFYWYTDTEMIISFDVGSETFGVIQGPKESLGGILHTDRLQSDRLMSIFEFEGCLCLRNFHHREGKADLWMLNDSKVDNGWVMMASFLMPTGMDNVWLKLKPHAIRKGEIILALCRQKRSETFCLYNFFSRKVDIVKVLGPDGYIILTDFVKSDTSPKDL